MGQSGHRKRGRYRKSCGSGNEINCCYRMIRRFGHYQLLAARKSPFAAIVRVGRGNAFTLFAAIRSFLSELPTAEAVEWPHEQEDCYGADRYVNAATHSTCKHTRSANIENRQGIFMMRCLLSRRPRRVGADQSDPLTYRLSTRSGRAPGIKCNRRAILVCTSAELGTKTDSPNVIQL